LSTASWPEEAAIELPGGYSPFLARPGDLAKLITA
jgi:hypothetical protein